MRPADIFTLAARDACSEKRLVDEEGFGARSVEKLFAAIEARREIPLDRFIYALGIRHVGEQTARDLARAFVTFDALREAVLDAADARPGPEYRRFLTVPGVGEKSAKKIIDVLSQARSKVLALQDAGAASADALIGAKVASSRVAAPLVAEFGSLEKLLEAAQAGAVSSSRRRV